jgi:hypothetical protein
MNESQLESLHAADAHAAAGTSGAADRCAAMRGPGATFFAGPRGPSGVIATIRPERTADTTSRMARPPPRVVDPRITPYPSDCATRAIISPSRCSLTRIDTSRSRLCHMSGSSCPCHKANTPPTRDLPSLLTSSSPTISIRHVEPIARRNALPRYTTALPPKSRRLARSRSGDKIARHLRHSARRAGSAKLVTHLRKSFEHSCALWRRRVQKTNQL